MVKKELDYSFELGEEPLQLAECRWNEARKYVMKEDASLEAGKIRYQVVCNENQMDPYLDFYENEEKKPKDLGTLYLYTAYIGDDVENFMKIKDLLLKDLKDKEIGSYEIAGVEQVTIFMNAETLGHVVDYNGEPLSFE